MTVRPQKFENSTGFLPEERQWFTGLINDLGFVDAYRELHPDDVAYTFWDQKRLLRPVNCGWRIDYFLLSAGLRPLLRKCDIWSRVIGSDHCPVVLELDLIPHEHYAVPDNATEFSSGEKVSTYNSSDSFLHRSK